MSFFDALTVLAILIGPIVGASLAVWLEQRREVRRRRLDVFRTLMRTRRNPISPDHVGALNLVEIEYHGSSNVISAWKRLFEHLGKPQPRHANEEINDSMQEDQKQEATRRYSERLYQERQSLLSKLLHAMASQLKYRIEQLEIFEGGYSPQGWSDVELEQTAIRRLFTDIYIGRRIFPIGVFHMPNTQESATGERSQSDQANRPSQ